MVTWKASLISGIKEAQANKDREMKIRMTNTKIGKMNKIAI